MSGSTPIRRAPANAVPYAERFKALGAVWPVLVVFWLVVGGIYRGLVHADRRGGGGRGGHRDHRAV